MSRAIVALLLTALCTSPAAAVVADAPTPQAQDTADDRLGLSVGLEVWGRSIIGMGLVFEYAFTDMLRAYAGANLGIGGRGFPLGLAVTPMGTDGFTPMLQGGVMIVRDLGGCGGECGEVETRLIGQASLGVAWYGERWWARVEGVAHWVGVAADEYLVLPGVSAGYTF